MSLVQVTAGTDLPREVNVVIEIPPALRTGQV